MPATLAQPVIIGIDRASGPELGVITFICGDCERTEHTQYCVLPEGWDLVEMDCTGIPFVRCPDCNEKIEHDKLSAYLADALASNPILNSCLDAEVLDGVHSSDPAPSAQQSPRPFSFFLEKQDTGKYLIAMTPESALMRWLPLGFFLSPAEAKTLADDLHFYAMLAEQTGTIPAKGERK